MLSDRLEQILSEIDKTKTLIDIGCDHGYVGFNAKVRGLCEKVIMTDISAPSLEKAKKLFGQQFCEDVKFVVSDGVKEVKDRFDFAVICGMGGLEIVKILEDERFDNALLQPMNNVPYVRESLVQMGFKIVSDRIFFDDKFYNVIKVKRGFDNLSDLEIQFGRTNLNCKGEDFVKYLKLELDKTDKILKGLCEDNKRFSELTDHIKKIERILNEN